MSLAKYIVKRILVMIPVLFGALIVGFFLSRMMPGDPVTRYLIATGNPNPDPILKATMRAQLGPDQPLITQFFRYLFELFTGNWGISVSVSNGAEVWDLIMLRLPRTIEISIFSMIIASIFGILTGVFSAKHRNKPGDTVVRFMALIGVSIPVFFLGILAQFFFAYNLNWFPATGFKTRTFPDPAFVTGFRGIDALISGEWYLLTDYLAHLVLPVLCLSFITLASITRQTRSSMLEVLEQDYIRTARAKGCKEKDVIYTHALKNSMLPTITIIGLNFAGLIGGAVLTETTFDLDGMGSLLINSIQNVDYWLLTALIFITTLMFVIMILITDLIYAILRSKN